jgi:hypothetical protein
MAIAALRGIPPGRLFPVQSCLALQQSLDCCPERRAHS